MANLLSILTDEDRKLGIPITGGWSFRVFHRWWRIARTSLGATLLFMVFGALPAAAQEITLVNLVTNDLVYDTFSQRIYASVPSAGGPDLGNSIVTIDPVAGVIESSVFIGSEPGPLAISDDGQFIYAGLDGAASVVRYHIPTATAELQIFLGSDSFYGPYYAEDIEVLPGSPNSIAVSRKNLGISPRHAGVIIYDDNIMRANLTQRHTGSNRIEFSGSSSLLYGYNNETTEFGFRQIDVSAAGATEIAVQSDLISGFGVDIEFEQGTVYSTTGRAIDPDLLVLLGTYSAVGPVSANANTREVFFVDGTTFKTFNMDTFIQSGAIEIPEIVGATGSLIGWGTDSLAFRTTSGQVFLIARSAPTEPPTEPPAVSELICDVEMSKATYAFGEDIVASRVRIANLSAAPVVAEGKFWFSLESGENVTTVQFDRDGLFDLAAGYDQDFGPVTLTGRRVNTPSPGIHEFNCRLIDAVTGAEFTLDAAQFEVIASVN